MTNEEAIEVFKNDIEICTIQQKQACDMAIKALEQQPCEDCISRQVVKDMLTAEWTKYMPMELDMNLSFILDKISALPYVTPRWIPVSERLPDKLQDVLITFYDAEGEYDVAYMRKTFNEAYKAQGSENEWVSSMGETTYADYEVNAWMPIQPYKAENEG